LLINCIEICVGSSKQRKPSEQVIIASKLLRFPIERRYSIMVDMIGEGEIYNPLEVIRHRNVREKKIDADSNSSDERYIRILDPWYVSSDELIAHNNWRKEQIIQHQMSVKVEEIDSNVDIQMKEALPAGLNTETNTFDKSVLSDEERSSGLYHRFQRHRDLRTSIRTLTAFMAMMKRMMEKNSLRSEDHGQIHFLEKIRVNLKAN
jgi:hypothetical protein